MAEPMILDLLDNLKTRVATNEVNIAQNTTAISTNKGLFDTHVADDTRHWTAVDRQNFDRVVHFKGYYTTETALVTAYPTGQAGDYAIVGATDTVWAWDTDNLEWINTSEQGVVITVNGRTGEVILTKTDVGLSNVDNTSDINKPISTAQQAALDAKANRKQITSAESDTFTLKAGIYDLYNVSKTILGFTSSYWTIIVGENNGQSGTQIWTNYGNDEVPHIYIRHQNTSGTAWTDFRELATNIDISGLQSQVTTNTTNIGLNTTDIADLKKDKADRGQATQTQIDGFALRAGIYNYQAERTILTYTDDNWDVIVGENIASSNDIKSVTQIWIPNKYANEASPKMFFRRATTASTWGSYVEILSSEHFTTLQNQITANATNIATNTTDISNLQTQKADRAQITDLNQLNGNTLKAGIYDYEQSLTILGYTNTNWTIYVGGNQGGTVTNSARTQIWIPYESTDSNNPKMFLRRWGTDSWGTFTEIITTKHITTDELVRAKQYKGYFATVQDLITEYATGNNGDFTIVGTSIYVWDSTTTTWVEVSSSGGGGGSGSVTSVNGMTGDVILTKTNIGLSNVDNTADSVKEVAKADQLQTTRVINGMNFNGTSDESNWQHCATAGNTAAKTIDVSYGTYTLQTGGEISVTFDNANTADNPTLNVNSTGAKAIYYNGSAIPAHYLQANHCYTLRYDGTNWNIVGEIGIEPMMYSSSDLYSSSSTYDVGDLVIYNGALYRCNTQIATAENWTAAHWTKTSILEILKNTLEFEPIAEN